MLSKENTKSTSIHLEAIVLGADWVEFVQWQELVWEEKGLFCGYSDKISLQNRKLQE